MTPLTYLFYGIKHEIQSSIVGKLGEAEGAKFLIRFSFHGGNKGEGKDDGVFDEIGDIKDQGPAPRFSVHDSESVGDPKAPERCGRQSVGQIIAVIKKMVGAIAVLALAAHSLTLGDYGLSAAQSYRRLLGDAGPGDDFLGVYFVQSVRLPRTIAGIGVGAALGLSGRLFQVVSSNALGSPDIVGFTAGSASGALVAIIVLGSTPVATSIGAVIGGVVSGALILALAGGTRLAGTRVVLVGIGVSAALRALNSLLLVKAPLEAAQRAQMWSAGSLSGVTTVRVVALVAALAACLPALTWLSRPLSLIPLGDDAATALGARTGRTRLVAVCTGIVLVSMATAVAGPVAFVALAAPHVAHRLTGAPGSLLAPSAAVGALLVLGSDIVAQRLIAPGELAVGVVTGCAGGVYLLVLLAHEYRRNRI